MDAAEDVKQRLGVEEVVGGYVQLKPAGRNLKGVCPFHQEKSPSFMVSPEKQIYHCFGCGEGGDIFTFIEKMEGLDFKGALELLAQRAGVDLDQYRSSKGGSNAQKKERLFHALKLAMLYYHVTLSRNQHALEYATKQRMFSLDTIKAFGVGYAPNARQAMLAFLRQRGVSDQDAVAAGLVRKRGSQLSDVFRGRLVVPLRDAQGRTVGFTGRILDNDIPAPKYLNTPQTLLYDKSRLLFGFDLAKESIRKSEVAVFVEGNLDVLSSYQAGIKNVVAASGTALTTQQLKQVSRLAPTVKLAFDSDAAGIKATERAIPLAQEVGVDLHIITLEGAKDPDELIQEDSSLWQQAIDNSQYAFDWLLQRLLSEYDATTAAGKRKISDRLSATVARIKDEVEREHYVHKLAEAIGASPDSVWAKVRGEKLTQPASQRKEAVVKAKGRSESDIVEDAILAMAVAYPETRSSLGEVPIDQFGGEQRRGLAEALIDIGQRSLSENIPDELHEYNNYVKILLLHGEERFRTMSEVDRQIEAFGLARRLHELKMKQTKAQLSAQIRKAEAAGNHDEARALLQQYQTLLK